LGLSLLLLLALAGRAGRVAASLMVAASVLAVVIVGPGRVGDILMGGHDVATNVTGTMDAGSRLEIWSRALYALADFPFTGMGLNVFRHIVPVMYPLFLVSPDVDIAHAHNHLLQVAVELGLPGLVAYVAIGLISTAMLVGVWRRSNRDQLPALAAGLGTGLLAYFIYGLTDTVALGAKPSVALWALLGLVVATFSLTDREKSERGALPVPMVQMTGQTSALSRD
jgi:putative inorganic carbon (HCO3(-)) transporter